MDAQTDTVTPIINVNQECSLTGSSFTGSSKIEFFPQLHPPSIIL